MKRTDAAAAARDPPPHTHTPTQPIGDWRARFPEAKAKSSKSKAKAAAAAATAAAAAASNPGQAPGQGAGPGAPPAAAAAAGAGAGASAAAAAAASQPAAAAGRGGDGGSKGTDKAKAKSTAAKPDLEALTAGLPAGWRAMWDKSSGDVYYGNTGTRVSERPSGSSMRCVVVGNGLPHLCQRGAWWYGVGRYSWKRLWTPDGPAAAPQLVLRCGRGGGLADSQGKWGMETADNNSGRCAVDAGRRFAKQPVGQPAAAASPYRWFLEAGAAAQRHVRAAHQASRPAAGWEETAPTSRVSPLGGA